MAQHLAHEGTAGRFPHVIGIGFEGQAPDGDGLAAQLLRAAVKVRQLGKEHALLRLVDGLHGAEDLHVLAIVVSSADQGLHVLGKAAAAVAAAGVEKVGADAAVGADAVTHVLDVRPHHFGQVGQLVHKADAGGEHGVGGVLGEFGAAHVHHDDFFVIAVDGRVGHAQLLGGPVLVAADDDAVAFHEVADGRAFFEEFGVGDHRELYVSAAGAQGVGNGGVHLVRSADRDGGLVDHHGGLLDALADGAGGGHDVLEIRAAVLGRRSADGDEDDLAVLHGLVIVGGELDALGAAGTLDDGVQTRLVDRYAAVVEQVDLLGVHVQADHVMAHVGETGAGHQADVAGADDGDSHAGEVPWGSE